MPNVSSLQTVVLVFFRSPTGLGPEAQRLWEAETPQADWLALLSTTPIAFRDDVLRVMVAAQHALSRGCPVLIVEGWRCHLANGDLVDGSTMGECLLQLLHQRGYLAEVPALWMQPQSRCTAEELHTALQVIRKREACIETAVTGPSCPSAPRIRAYAALLGEPLRVVNSLNESVPEDLRHACAPRWHEKVYNGLFEWSNWAVYVLSNFESALFRRNKAALMDRLEVRLVRRFRKDWEDS